MSRSSKWQHIPGAPNSAALQHAADLSVFLATVLAGSLAIAQSPPSPSRELIVQHIATNVLAANWQQAALESKGLTNCLARLAGSPNRENLESAQAAWLELANTISRLRCFQSGPLAERDCTGTFYYWQVLGPRIESILQSTTPIDQELLDRLGSTTRGLFAVEYLLFDRSASPAVQPAGQSPALTLLSAPEGERRGAYLLALGHDLERKSALIAADWGGPEKQAFSAKFAAGGQQSLNLLVNQLASAIEYEASRHLQFVLVLRPPISDQLDRIERNRSNSSLQGVLSALEGARQLYRGGEGPGIDDAVNRLNEPLEKRVEAQFEAAISAVRAIGMPLEQAAVDNRAAIEAAYEKTHALEVLIKVDVASALGITLTFSSNDGD